MVGELYIYNSDTTYAYTSSRIWDKIHHVSSIRQVCLEIHNGSYSSKSVGSAPDYTDDNTRQHTVRYVP